MSKKRSTATAVETVSEIKVDLGTVLFPLTKFPWPFENNSVDEITCVHVLNKISSKLRGAFMDEAWRILKPEGKMSVISPYYSHMRAYADFAYEWPPLCEMSFLYFNKEWRNNNKTHQELKCDFDFTYGYAAEPDTATRSQDVQATWIKRNLNSVLDVQAHLVKRK